MIRQTSLEAYERLRYEVNGLGKRQQAVYELLRKKSPLTDRQISRLLGWPINTVTPRRGELLKKGVIMRWGYLVDSVTNRSANTWGVLQ